MAYIVVRNRPSYPEMADIDVLQPGAIIEIINNDYGPRGPYRVLERPRFEVETSYPGMKVRLKRVKPYSYLREFIDDMYLSDMGLVPYESGAWNNVNWVKLINSHTQDDAPVSYTVVTKFADGSTSRFDGETFEQILNDILALRSLSFTECVIRSV